MSSVISCHACGKRLRIPAEAMGKRVKCPGCSTVLATDQSSAGNGDDGRIVFLCGHCQRVLRVEQSYRGKQVRCPSCSTGIRVPDASTSTAGSAALSNSSADPRNPAPAQAAPAQAAPAQTDAAKKSPALAAPTPDRWFLHSADGNKYGPISKAELDEWVAEGIVTAQCLISRNAADHWQLAANFYQGLPEPAVPPPWAATGAAATGTSAAGDSASTAAPPAVHPAASAPPPPPAPTGTSGAAGQRLLRKAKRQNTMAMRCIQGELKKLPGASIGSDVVYEVGDPRSIFERLQAGTVIGFSSTSSVDVDLLHLVTVRHPQGDFHVVATFDNGTPAPSEFLAVVNGSLPAPIGLLRGEGGNWGIDAAPYVAPVLGSVMRAVGGQPSSSWVGPGGDANHPVAQAAESNAALKTDLKWDATINMGPMTVSYKLDWIAQAMPLSPQQYLLVGRYVPNRKFFGFNLGASWFAQWRDQFSQFAASLEVPSAPEPFECFAVGPWWPVAAEALGLPLPG